jgi:uncharacterized membrane protein YdjX (TVP38/TMEM64 family)
MTDPAPGTEERRSPVARWLVGVAVLLIVAACFVLLRERVGTSRDEVEAWVRSLGAAGPVAFVGAYVLLTTLASPMWPLTVLSGMLFGPVKGVAISSLASTLAAAAGMLGSRYLVRDFVERRLRRSSHFVRLDTLIETHGAAVVAFTRLVPLFPFSPLNLAFGLTSVRATTYLFWSWLCMLPMILVYVVGGSAFKTAITERRVPWAAIAVVAGVAGVVFFVGRGVRRKMTAGGSGASADR